MANSALQGKTYDIPPNILAFLETKKNSEGSKRVNNWLTSKIATYEQLKRFKHDIENQYQEDWGEVLSWINSLLSVDRDSLNRNKKDQMEIGVENKFRTTHDKDYNSVEATKVTPLNESKKTIIITESQLKKLKTNL